jgi:AcrR family transcriptional regulator
MTEHQHLSRETILRTAIEIADQGGIDKVSMRAIASRFEVTAMSLYRHVAGKDAILDGMIDQVVAEVALAELPDWKETVRTAAISTRDVLVRHPWAPAMWLSRQSEGPARLRWGDFLLRALGNGALSEEAIFHAYHILESQILGSTLQQLSFPYAGEELAGMARDFLEHLPRDDYPDLVTHIEAHLRPPSSAQSGFEFALDLILDGLERSRTGRVT